MRRVLSPLYSDVLDYEEEETRLSGHYKASSKARTKLFAASILLTLALISIPSFFYIWRFTGPTTSPERPGFVLNQEQKLQLREISKSSCDPTVYQPDNRDPDGTDSSRGGRDNSKPETDLKASSIGIYDRAVPEDSGQEKPRGKPRVESGASVSKVNREGDVGEKLSRKSGASQERLVRLEAISRENEEGESMEGVSLLQNPEKIQNAVHVGEKEEKSDTDEGKGDAVEEIHDSGLTVEPRKVKAVDYQHDVSKDIETEGDPVRDDAISMDTSGGVEIKHDCPSYREYTKEDLHPWIQRGGISLENLDTAVRLGTFRVQVVNESVYVHEWGKCFQSRAKFTIWGLLQLITSYPGRVPDVDLVFECNDSPVVERAKFDFHPTPPPVISFCSTGGHLDLVWPDWSFWGWPEINLPNWPQTHASILRGTASIPWADRIPRAFWKGAVWVAPSIRQPIVDCNDEPLYRWRVESSDTKWDAEKDSNTTKLENQCKHRYKIYAEGTSWSCSLKYILACGSTVLRVNPLFFDFFSRQLKRNVHFLPIPRHDESIICPSFKEAVDWGEVHEEEAKAIGERGAEFVKQQLSMHQVYDYMLNFLVEYHKILKFDVTPLPESQLRTVESMLAAATDFEREFMHVESASRHVPCFAEHTTTV